MKRFTALFLAAVVGLIFQTSLAQAKEPGPGDFHHEMNLTPQQHKQIAELKLAQKKLVAPVKAELSIKKDEIKILWMSDNPSRKDILAKQDEIAALHKKIQEAKVDFRLAMMKILTPEQQKKMREMMFMHHRHERRGGPNRFDHDE